MLPRTTAEQRTSFYSDVDSMLAPGFLTHPVVVGGVRLHLRSLGPGDLFMLSARTAGHSALEWRVWVVASSIWLVDGRSVLGQDEAIPFLAGYVRRLPGQVLDILFSLVLGLWVRVTEAMDAIEVFCFETLSRYRWKSLGAAGLHHSGVPGADRLGMNPIQRMWVAFNEVEDTKRSEETAWEGFKLVASSNAPKAITKMDKADRQRREEEVAERQRRLDLFYYGRLGLVDPKSGSVQGTDGSVHRIQGAKSVEDLEEEMRRWVTDEQDIHDRIVADYKERLRSQYEAAKAEREARREALRLKREEMEGENFRPRPLVALTAEQLQHVLAQRGPGQGVAFLPATPVLDERRNRYGIDPLAGNLTVAGGKVIDPAADPDVDRRTLEHLIKNRNPSFGVGE